MGNGYTIPAQDELDRLKQILVAIERALRELQAADGSQLFNAYVELRNLVNNLATQIENVSASGATWQGPVSAGSGNITTTSGYVFTPAGYAYDITYTRRAAWLGNDGRLGWASSSREHKTNIRDANIDPLAVLKIAPRLFNYKAEVEKHKDDPDYKVATEFGAIAEEMADLGLWQAVIYENGKPVGIHYDLIGLLAVAASQHVWAEHLKLADRVAALEAR